MTASEISIGIDVGGTHTDLCAVQNANIVRANALTTHQYTYCARRRGLMRTLFQP